MVSSVGVVLREGDVHTQGHAVGKDGQEDENVKRSQVNTVKDPERVTLKSPYSFGAFSTQR